jgi:proteic killer suppression protein
MDVEFADDELDRLEIDHNFTAGFEKPIVRAFRKVMQTIRAATDERDLYAIKGLRFEKLKGQRAHQRSMRLNDRMRLIVELKEGSSRKTVSVVAIEDYH